MNIHKRNSGFMLLEIVVAVGLLILGMAVIGIQVQSSAERARKTDQTARVTFLAESKFAEIDTGLIQPSDDVVEDDFGRLFPAYAWRLEFEPTGELDADSGDAFDRFGLAQVRLEIYYDPLRDPDDDFDYDQAEVVGRYYTLRAAPRPLDLTQDFGMEDDVAERLNEDLANSGDGSLDVHNFDPATFASLDLDQILEIAPLLMEAFGMSETELLALVPEEFKSQLEAILAAQGEGEGGGEAGEVGDESGAGGDETGGGASGGGDQGGRDQGGGGRGRGDRGRGDRGGRDGGGRGGSGNEGGEGAGMGGGRESGDGANSGGGDGTGGRRPGRGGRGPGSGSQGGRGGGAQ
jgi:type II secretory pathway pseudopilin PulG